MYLVAWSVLDDDDRVIDNFVVVETLQEARDHYGMLPNDDSLWCAAITKVIDATEPHWIDTELGRSNNVIGHAEDNATGDSK